ncbi:MAG: DUF6515 family protein [Bacteroidota bacterium]
MRSTSAIIILTFIGILANTDCLHAQRVVVRTPFSTIVRTGPRVVYAHPVPNFRVVRTLPPTATVVTYGGLGYYYYGGLFYRYYNGAYVIVGPPVGITVNVLPKNHEEVIVGTDIYYYHQGSFYIKTGDKDYKIVQPPLNAIVKDLPEEAEKVKIDGETYYQYNETLYKKIKTVGGKAFKVVGKIENANY